MTDVKRPATGARAHTPCKDLSKAVDGGRIQCAVLHVPLSLPTNEGGERDGQPVCALLTALACDLLETTRTTKGGGCEFGVFYIVSCVQKMLSVAPLLCRSRGPVVYISLGML